MGDTGEQDYDIETYFLDESQEILIQAEWGSGSCELTREYIESPAEYFMRKLIGE